MVAYPGHILESTKGMEIKLATYIDVNEMFNLYVYVDRDVCKCFI